MNDSNTPYSKNREITSKSQSMHGRGLRKSHSLPEYVPPYSKKPHFPMHNRSQRTKEGIKAAFQAEIRTPVSEKTGKTNPNRSYS